MRTALALWLACAAVPAGATNVTLTIGGLLALTPGDGITDLSGYDCECGNFTAIAHQGGSRRAQSSNGWAATTLAYALTLDYPAPIGDGFIPSPDDVFVIKTSDDGLYKLRPTGTNTSAGVDLEYEYLGSSAIPPPDSSFTFETYDVVAFLTDTSTGTASSWTWDFGDGSGASSQNPRHVFSPATAADSFIVTLTAGNAGSSDATPAFQEVPIVKRTSEFVLPGGSKDLDGDGIADLLLFSPGCGTEIPNALSTINGAKYSSGGDYRTADLAEAEAAAYTSGSFCVATAAVESATLLNTSAGSLLKLWLPENDAVLGVRFEFELLSNALPDPPNSSFTWSAIDLIATFADTSTGSPSNWSWNFGDGAAGGGQGAQHVFHDPGSFSVCLAAGNVGGVDTSPDCQTVTVTEVPSTLLEAGSSIDLDGNGPDDLQIVASMDCGSVPQLLRWIGGSQASEIGEAYSSVDLGDALGASYGSSDRCGSPGSYVNTLVVRTGLEAYVKLWIAASDERGTRIQYEILQPSEDEIFADGFESGSTCAWLESPC